MAAVTVAKPAVDEAVARRLELAQRMIELGASVFPLQPGGKKPLIGRNEGGKGFLDASPDAHMAQVFLSNPGKPNYGVAFPVGSDVFVLDLDGGGDDSNPDWKEDWQRLYEQLGPPGLTYIVRTASGGRHVYYRWREDLYGPMPPGDEMLGWTVRKPWKGYLVGPGSIVEGQVYEPVGIQTISDFPEAWARAALEEAQQRASKPFIRVGGGNTPVDVKKGHRHAFLRDKARHLVGVGLTGEALFTAVMDINRQLVEPKTEDEVRRAIGDAETKFEHDPIEPSNTRAHGGRAMRTTTDELPELPFYTAVDIEQMPGADVDWAWHGYLAHGAVTELVGGPKVGKTTLVFGLIEAIVTEQEFLGQKTTAGAVVVLSEQGPTSLREVLRRTGLAARADVHFLLHRDVRGEDWPVVVAAARAHCDRSDARVLVVDTLPAFAGLSGETENNAGDALEAMEPLMGAAADGLAVLVNRHRRKGGAADIADEGRGSSAFSGAVDVILTLRRKPGMARHSIRELVAASRFDDTPEELIVELDENKGYVALGTEQAIAAQEAEQAVLEVLAEKDGLTNKELLEAVGKVRRTVDRALADLLAAGKVDRVGAGGRKDPYRWIRGEKFDVRIAPPLRGAEVLRTTDSEDLRTGSASPLGAAEGSAARPDHVEAQWVSPCRDYSAHHAHHRKTNAGWICDICSGEGAA